ncbi:MAG: hypothetical protein U0271_11260 [Polyangiaceae bacterium]
MSSAAPAILLPLDRARVAFYRLFGSSIGPWFASRELRVTVIACSVLLTSILGALFAPLYMLALGPIVMGVPHIVSDLRYLVARPGLHKRGLTSLSLAAFIVAGGALNDLRFVCGGVVMAILLGEGSLPRKVVLGACAAPLVAGTLLYPGYAQLALAHGHNFIAVALWLGWARVTDPERGPRGWATRRSLVALPMVVLTALVVTFVAGGFDSVLAKAPSWLPPIGQSMRSHAASLAPGFGGAWPLRLVGLFAFAQAVHYGIWLRLVPEDDRPRRAPRSFSSSWVALRQDLGLPLLLTAVALAIIFAGWAVVDLIGARSGYLRFAVFHGQLEVVAATLFLVERRRIGALELPREVEPARQTLRIS